MKTDNKTAELPGLPVLKKRGRPKKEGAKTGAQRQAEYWAKRRPVVLGDRMTETIKALADEFDLDQSKVVQHLVRFALCNRNWRQTGFPSD